MFRTAIFLAILFVSTIFLPFWVQILLYILSVFFVKYRFLILIPAIFSDIWYAPYNSFSLGNNKTFLIVLSILSIYFLINKVTRKREKYGF